MRRRGESSSGCERALEDCCQNTYTVANPLTFNYYSSFNLSLSLSLSLSLAGGKGEGGCSQPVAGGLSGVLSGKLI